MGKQMCQ